MGSKITGGGKDAAKNLTSRMNDFLGGEQFKDKLKKKL